MSSESWLISLYYSAIFTHEYKDKIESANKHGKGRILFLFGEKRKHFQNGSIGKGLWESKKGFQTSDF